MIAITKNTNKMKKLFFLLTSATFAFSLGSCRDQAPEPATHTTEVIREVRVETKDEPKSEGFIERTGKKIDKKVNDKIDEKIDEID